MFVTQGFVCIWCSCVFNITVFEQALNVCNYVIRGRMLWHISVNVFSCITYCKEYCNLLFLEITCLRSVLYLGYEFRFKCTVAWKRWEVYLSTIRTPTIYIFHCNFSLNIFQSWFFNFLFYFPFPKGFCTLFYAIPKYILQQHHHLV